MIPLIGGEAREGDVAVRWEGGEFTYAQLSRAADQVASELRSHGVRPGRVVAFRTDASVASLVVLHGVWRVSSIAAPLHSNLMPAERDEALAALEPNLFIEDPAAFWDGVADTGFDLGTTADRARDTAHGAPTDVAAVVWTSGSTGSAKGVKLTWTGFRCMAAGSAARMALGSSDRWLLSLSPAAMGGLALVVRAALLGSSVMVGGAFNSEDFASLAGRGDFTHASLVPTQLRRVLAARVGRPAPPSLRGILLGGAPAPAPLLQEALELGYPVFPTYGMTETTSQIATADPKTALSHPGTVGRSLDGVAVRVGPDGRILVRGPTVSPGTLAGPLRTEGGWFETGDLGWLDERGHLFVTGRLGDRIVSGGVTVHPLEVERVLEAHHHVERACVVGRPDADWGECIVAVLVTSIGASLDTDSLLAHLRERLRPALRPKALYRIESDLPLAKSGKLDRAAMRRLVIEHSSRLTALSGG